MKNEKSIKLSELLMHISDCKASHKNFMSQLMPQLIHDVKQLEETSNEKIKQLFTYHEFNVEDYLQYPDSPIKNLWLIEEGVAYSIVENIAHDNIKEFHFPGEFVGNLNNFQAKLNSFYAIRVLEPLRCWSLNCNELCNFCKENSLAAHIMQYMLIAYNTWENGIIMYMKILPLKERFTFINENFPKYFSELKRDYFARFVGCSLRRIYATENQSASSSLPEDTTMQTTETNKNHIINRKYDGAIPNTPRFSYRLLHRVRNDDTRLSRT